MKQGTVMRRWKQRFWQDCPKRDKSVVALRNGNIGMKDFSNKDFISGVLGNYLMFVEPIKHCQVCKI
jgi:hypothetical protein